MNRRKSPGKWSVQRTRLIQESGNKMASPMAAEDVGFVVRPSDLESKGMSLEWRITVQKQSTSTDLRTRRTFPTRSFLTERPFPSQGTVVVCYDDRSDQARDSDVVHSLLPFYHTPSHCKVISTPHIPHARNRSVPHSIRKTFFSVPEVRALIVLSGRIWTKMRRRDAKRELDSLRMEKSQYAMNGDMEQVNETEKEIDRALVRVNLVCDC